MWRFLEDGVPGDGGLWRYGDKELGDFALLGQHVLRLVRRPAHGPWAAGNMGAAQTPGQPLGSLHRIVLCSLQQDQDQPELREALMLRIQRAPHLGDAGCQSLLKFCNLDLSGCWSPDE
ncbi:uncharacterized protein LOC144581440 isoform X2 [Callithrix jacchus]